MKPETYSNMPEGFEQTITSFRNLARAFSEQGFNSVPFSGSWTGAQVIDHVVKSNRSIVQALAMEGKPVDRRPDERKQELAGVFLDFSTRLKAPDFILPGQDAYVQPALINSLQASTDALEHGASVVKKHHGIEHPAFGEITQWELLYFVLYHTQRHLKQLQHIYEIVENRQYKLLSFLFTQPVTFF